jgi:hypothetical protein
MKVVELSTTCRAHGLRALTKTEEPSTDRPFMTEQ